MLIAGKNNDRFFKHKDVEKFYLVNTNNFHHYNRS